MIPGEMKVKEGDIALNEDRPTLSISVENTGDRPIQVGSHYHFFEVNPCLIFERGETMGYRLNISAGTAVRFEPGQKRTVELVAVAGKKEIYGFRGLINGTIEGQA